MLILHAGFLNNRLLLWGESDDAKQSVPAKRRGRKPLKSPLERYSYCANTGFILSELERAELKSLFKTAETAKAALWAPSAEGKPLASSSLIAETPADVDSLVLKAWGIEALSLTTSESIDFLCFCIGEKTLAPGLIIGSDLAFWAHTLRFAGALLARQQFLPTVIREGDNYYARWETVFDSAGQENLSRLAKAMPASCRAITSESSSPPVIPSVEVLKSFIDTVADHLIRAADPALSVPRRKGVIIHFPVFDNLHDQWLYALTTEEGALEGDKLELAKLTAQVQDWRRPIYAVMASPFKLCFRLEEPGEPPESVKKKPADSWRVNYLLQEAVDPSLMIPADNVWNPHKRKFKGIFEKYGFNPREYLLSALGQALTVCPEIEKSLKFSSPEGYSLDNAQAFKFLTDSSLSLKQAGFEVMLPSWWTRSGSKQRLTIQANVKSPKLKSKAGFTLDSIIEFDWEAALGGMKMTLKELEMLAKLKQPLVKVRGEWVVLEPQEIQAAIDFWKRKSGEAKLGDLVRISLGAEPLKGGLEFGGVQATGWVGQFLSQLQENRTLQEIPSPAGFKGELRPYQVKGFSWLSFLKQWGLGACLADDMGLGKTIQTLALLLQEKTAGEKRPVLLICPTTVVNNWRKEAEKFTPELTVQIHHGMQRSKGAAFKKEIADKAIVISSYALLHRDFELMKDISWAGIILDEAQNIKNPETKQAQASRALQADYRIALTGTPVENNVGDLWSIMDFLNPGLLGNQSEFKSRFFLPIQTGSDLSAAGRLKKITGPFILRRLKTDKSIITDLPEKIEAKVYCNLTKEQASLYEAVVKDTMESLKDSEGIQRKGQVLATLAKLKQVCNHPAHFLKDKSAVSGRSGKLNRLSEMLEEMLDNSDERCLIFTQFYEMGAILKGYLQSTFGQEILFLHGQVEKKKRDKMVEQFQAGDNGLRIFILSLKAGGTGLNLTNANQVFHFDRWWNPAVENQATDRVFRIGQTRNVLVHKYVCAGTLEEKIDAMIESKKEIAEKVIGTGEGWLTELSTAELKELFALSKDAVGE